MRLRDRFALLLLGFREYKDISRALKELLRQAHYDQDGIGCIRVTKLRSLLESAALSVPFYTKGYRSEIEYILKQSDDDLLKTFSEMPVITKQVIRDAGSDFWNGSIDRFVEASTGGTTGSPLKLRKDLECNAITKAALFRAKIEWGIHPGDKMVYLISFGKGSFLGKLRMRLGGKLLLDAFPSSKVEAEETCKIIQKYKPKALEGFASGILSLLNVVDRGVIRVPIVVSTGEMLYENQRREIETKLNAKVYTYYGSNEVGSIAYECEKGKLHVCEDHVIVETIDENGRLVFEQEGRVVVTDLDNRAMPFIRYELGDLAVLTKEPCTCGKSGMIITKLVGRSQDYLSSPIGNRLQATQLSAYLKDLIHVGQMQFIQLSETEIHILFTGDESVASAELAFVNQHILNRLGAEVKLQNKKVDEIAKTNRGKQPLVLRKIG